VRAGARDGGIMPSSMPWSLPPFLLFLPSPGSFVPSLVRLAWALVHAMVYTLILAASYPSFMPSYPREGMRRAAATTRVAAAAVVICCCCHTQTGRGGVRRAAALLLLSLPSSSSRVDWEEGQDEQRLVRPPSCCRRCHCDTTRLEYKRQ